jgi:hypothetical protein
VDGGDPVSTVDLSTPESTRAFLALCLNPPGREGRTLDQLAKVLPAWVMTELRVHAPELGRLRDELTKAEAETRAAQRRASQRRAAFAKALDAWISEGADQ